MSYSKILIAVDSSEFSIHAAQKGFELAQQMGAKVALLYIIDASKAIGNIDAGILAETAVLILKKEAEKTLEQLVLVNSQTDVLKFMPEGYPSKDIIKSAEIWGADLIVLGTHNHRGLTHFFAGSVAEQVLHHSKIPVMIVPLI